MSKEVSFFMLLPRTEREKLREKQKLRTYREYTRNLTSIDFNVQMEAESNYLVKENEILYRRLTKNDTELLKITPDNFRILGRLAKRLARRFHADVSIMKYADLIRGYEYYQASPPSQKSNQIPLEVEQRIVDMALENLTWGSPHIVYAMRNIGFFQLKEHHVRTALKKNHIPISAERIRKGLPWGDFIRALHVTNDGGVIFR